MPEWRNRQEEAYNEPVEVRPLDEQAASGWITTEEVAIPSSVIQIVARDPLVVWAEKFHGIPLEFWQELGVKSEGEKYITFNWPGGWKKARNVHLRVDVKTTKDKTDPRFFWVSPPPNGVHPLWPTPNWQVKHREIYLAEGESDCAVLRFLGFDAYTFGSSMNIPGAIELRALELMGVERAILVMDADKSGRTAAEKLSTILSETNHIDTVPIDLGKILFQWPYLKDVRDLFNQLPADDVRAVLLGARASILDMRDEDISASRLAERAADPEWVWDGLFAKAALNMLYAEPKIGKTTLTYHLIKAGRGDGGMLLDRKVRPQKFLYYSEMPESFDKHVMLNVCDFPPDNLWVRNSSASVFEGMTWPAIVGQIERDVKKYQINYVIVDTVIEWFKFQTEEMYDPSAVGEKLRLLRRLTANGVTVQINHHPPKSGGSPLGSIAFQGYVDCLVDMARDESGTVLSAKGRLRTDFSSIKYGYADEEGRTLAVFSVDDKGDRAQDTAAAKLGVKQKILSYLPYAPGGMTLEELREKDESLRSSDRQLATRMREMVKDGKVGETKDDPPRFYRDMGFEIQIKETSSEEPVQE